VTDGVSVARSMDEAIEWVTKSVKRLNSGIWGFGKVKCVEGCYTMGRYYEDGKGVPQDHGEAVKWFKLAVEQGHPGIGGIECLFIVRCNESLGIVLRGIGRRK
jgi:hypothetical protein